MKTQDPAVTILSRCDEVLELEDELNRYWEQQAVAFARDLRDAVEALREVVEIDDNGRIMGQAGRFASHVLTTIAHAQRAPAPKRGEAIDDR